MKLRLVLVIVLSMVVGAVGSHLWAQTQPDPPMRLVTPGTGYGEIISGADIGFQRVVSLNGQAPAGKIIGRLLIRVDGQWLEAQGPITIAR
jgi:hypothetical protein